MRHGVVRGFARPFLAALVAVLLVVPGFAPQAARAATASVGNGLTTTDLNAVGMTAEALAQELAGTGVTVSNVTFKGAYAQAGKIDLLDPAVVSFNHGIILSSGYIADVVGPNSSDGITGDMAGQPGFNAGAEDTDLTALIAGSQTVNPMTYDAVVLEFDFVPSADTVYFTYVFGSDEYLEWVNLFNDVFAFYVNGQNCATVPGGPVSIDTINDAVNAALFRDNSFSAPPANPINIQSDGLSVELICSAPVTPNVINHMKLALADTSDQILDSVVMIKAASLSVVPPESCNNSVDDDDDGHIDMDDTKCQTTTTPPPAGGGGIGGVGGAPAFTGIEGTPILLDPAVFGWVPQGDTVSTTWTVVGINGATDTCEISPAGYQLLDGGNIATATAICPQEGEYKATVQGWPSASGGLGDEFGYDVDFFVHNAPPSVGIAAPLATDAITTGQAVDLIADVTDPGTYDTATCTVDWGDETVEAATRDAAANLCTASHTWAATGIYIVTLKATDDAGDTGASAVVVTVGDGGGLLPQAISWTSAPPASAAYGDTFDLAATGGDSGNPVTFTAGGGCSLTDATVTMTSSTVGCDITADQAGDATYDAAPQLQATVTATTRAITVSADPQSKAYGTADPTLTWQVTAGSLVGTEQLSGALTRDAGEALGQYAITQGSLAASADYDLTYAGALLTISGTAPSITTNPADKTVAPNTSVSFSAAATANPAATVHWQVLPLNGTWTDIGGATSTTYTFTAAAGDTGKQFRAIFTNPISTAATTAALLTVTMPTYTLTVAKSGTGEGTVNSSPRGIKCGTTCSASFKTGTVVTLTAVAAAGSRFQGWTGACYSAATSCVVTMSAARSVTAIFKAIPALAYTGTTSVQAGGTIALQATAKTAGGVPIAAITVGFQVGGGAVIPAVTDGSGTAWATTAAPATPGSTTITTSFAGDADYAPSTAVTTTLAVLDPATIATLAVAPMSCSARGSCTITVTLTGTGGPIAGANGIKVTVAGKTYRASATDVDGVTTVTFTAPRTVGTYPVGASWPGDATHAAASGTGTLTVV